MRRDIEDGKQIRYSLNMHSVFSKRFAARKHFKSDSVTVLLM